MKAKKHTKLYEWQQRVKNGSTCLCGETRFLTVDHIIPVSILEQFVVGDRGRWLQYEWEENFRLLCKWCNQEKKHTLPVRHPEFFTLFRKLLEMSEQELRPKLTPTIEKV